ncbi:competence/damage-inducible protein A [bacterium]|nr:competence/damage-inducible protein A [bacterium]
MTAEIVVIGDEILLGLIIDTNSAFISRRLAELGTKVNRITKVGDNIDSIAQAFEKAAKEADMVICCGGLGPTHDDKTRDAAAKFLGAELKLNESAFQEIQSMYKKAGRVMSETNRVQAMIPEGAAYLSNSRGTAPGLSFKKDRASFFCLQGVPSEMQWMAETHVFPVVQKIKQGKVLKFRTLRTVGIPESALYEKTKEIVQLFHDKLDIAFLPQMTRGVDIRLTCSVQSAEKAAELIADAEGRFVSCIGQFFSNAVYGYDDETLEQSLAQLFFDTGQTIATAESCTGGLIAHRLTNVSGSSSFFLQGVTTYSNDSKMKLLNVPEKLLTDHGAVSEEVAKSMAENIRKMAGTNLGLSTTGIAGPTGATEHKPVGLAYIGFSTDEKTSAIKLTPLPYAVDRLVFKERLSQMALDVVRKHLVNLKELLNK